jgi:hypothetical protein
MSSSPTTSYVLSGLTLLLAGALLYVWVTRPCAQAKYARLPPGPKPHWLLGNELPSKYPWRYFEQLTKEYGDQGGEGCITIWQGQTPLVVVGRVAA